MPATPITELLSVLYSRKDRNHSSRNITHPISSTHKDVSPLVYPGIASTLSRQVYQPGFPCCNVQFSNNAIKKTGDNKESTLSSSKSLIPARGCEDSGFSPTSLHQSSPLVHGSSVERWRLCDLLEYLLCVHLQFISVSYKFKPKVHW